MNQKQSNNSGKEYAKWSSLAMQGIVSIVGLTLLGKYLDKHLNSTKPVYTLIGIGVGSVFFFYRFFKTIFSEQK